MKTIVTGCAGFIGSNLVDHLLTKGHEVVGIDNLSTGKKVFLEEALSNEKFKFIEEDILSCNNLSEIFNGAEIVYHFSANADVRFGLENTQRDLDQNTVATYRILEAMKKSEIKKIVFSSTGSVYGESKLIPTPEDYSFPIQTSLYAASKVAAESLITSFCYGFNMQCWIFRFVSILGPRYSHGHVYDFYKKLMINQNKLEVLGNGKQKKSYLHIYDCISAIEVAIKEASGSINIFNLGTEEYCEVNDSIAWITNELGYKPQLEYSGGDRGWIGDNPFIFLDVKKIKKLGWSPKYSIKEGVLSTLRYLQSNDWLFEK
tara:strand:- start:1399 stop:2349 length:951 start_codon:yes stop_codon:yes gene_type:complete